MNNNYIKVKIEGKNVNNFIKWLVKQHINIININIIKYNLLELIIDYKDYNKLFKYSKTYKIEIIKKYGKIKIVDIFKKRISIIISILVSIAVLYFLSNIIFSIDIIYNNKEIIDIVKKELEKNNIKKYQIKKDYKYLNKVKEKILNDNKDILEWLEIEEYGTKYIVRIVERKKDTKNKSNEYQSIVAKKNAIITNIRATSGEKAKTINDYVKKGETIINGILTGSSNENIFCKAEGQVYGEVWYKVDIEYPLYYREEKITGKSKKVLVIRFLNKKIYLFQPRSYKHFKSNNKILIRHNLIPLEISKERIYETNIKEKIYTKEEAVKEAINESKQQLFKKNSNINALKEVNVLSEEILGSRIKLTIFISVIEDITEIQEISSKMIQIEKKD